MELELEEKLQDIYTRLKVEVVYEDIRKYFIYVTIKYEGFEYESKIEYIYDAKLTFDTNIRIIVHIIDSKIIAPFYKEKGE